MIIGRRWYSIRDIQTMTGKSRPTLDRWERNGTMPRGRRWTARTLVWGVDEIDGWLRGEWVPPSDSAPQGEG